ncbi:acetyl esterase/lipase [Mariniflexile fucanivorans]|uniref:Acetyl esterase/lipase n=1 Tax=Mariniflexile fucanivorans TaxID=264023 RepID=A0A4R1RHI4_9FLAO|nr:alpha/beta hydrolase [Mariniflexile fucanivorans]TCL65389.1 acetyl esterase/lipase [Mariniflexile fucanivorans]
MKGFKYIASLILTICIVTNAIAQEKPSFPPYTIELTYQKLKKDYPFITPIEPLKSKEIKYKENIVYKKTNTSKLKLDVYIPNIDSNIIYPAVLLIHGGGWLTGSKENQRIMAQYLALKGYVGISVSYRLGLEAPYPAGVIDLKDAIVYMRKNAKKYHVNTDKIAVLGASAGAQLATLVGVTPNSSLYEPDAKISDEVQAIINIDGITSFVHPEASSEGKMARIWLNGSKEENYKNWKEASPLEYVDKNTPPTLFINSTQPRFHAGRDDMITMLNKYHIYNEMYTITESPHSFWLMHPWFETTLNYTIAFLNKVFKYDTNF